MRLGCKGFDQVRLYKVTCDWALKGQVTEGCKSLNYAAKACMSLGCNRLDESRRKMSDEMSCTRLGEARLYKVT